MAEQVQAARKVEAPRHPPVGKKKYETVADDLRRQIAEKKYPVGARLPSIDALSKMYGFSRVTVHRGMRILVAEGLVDVAAGCDGSRVRSAATKTVMKGTVATLFRSLYGCTEMERAGLPMIQAVCDEINRRGLQQIQHTVNHEDCAARIVELARKGGVGSVLLDQATPLSTILEISRAPAPVVLFGRSLLAPNVSCVAPDYAHMGRETLARLREMGCERFVFCCSRSDERTWNEALFAVHDGYLLFRGGLHAAASEAGCEVEEAPEPATPAAERMSASYGLPRKKPADWKRLGAVCFDSSTAVALLASLEDGPYALGEDVEVVVAVSCAPEAPAMRKASVWRADLPALARTALGLIVERMGEPQAPPRAVATPVTFVEREAL